MMTRLCFLGTLAALPFFPWGKRRIEVDAFSISQDENGETVIVEGKSYEYWK